MGGVFAVARSIWDDDDFADEPFTERQAMIWLVGAAAWREKTVRINAVPVKVCRGEFCFAERFLATKWGWTKSRVHRFLNRLSDRGIVSTRTSEPGFSKNGEKSNQDRTIGRTSTKVYKLNKYNEFQVLWKPGEPTSEPAPEPSPNQVRTKEEEHLKQDKIDISKDISYLSPPLDEEHAREVIAYRKKRKQSNSKLALTRLANQLSLYERPNEGAAEMMVRGWKGFDPEWMKSIPRGTGPPAKEKHFRNVVEQHIQEVDSAEIVELRPSRQALRGPDS